jgi:hypothetical protein
MILFFPGVARSCIFVQHPALHVVPAYTYSIFIHINLAEPLQAHEVPAPGEKMSRLQCSGPDYYSTQQIQQKVLWEYLNF